MKHIYYFITVLFIIKELAWLISPLEQTLRNKKFKEQSKLNKGISKWDEYTDEYKELLKYKALPGLMFVCWLFFGLMTFNWVAFVFLLALQFVVVAPLSKLTQYNYIYTAIHWFNSLIGFCFGVFVIVNSYHLKIDLQEWVTAFFNAI